MACWEDISISALLSKTQETALDVCSRGEGGHSQSKGQGPPQPGSGASSPGFKLQTLDFLVQKPFWAFVH